MAPLILKRVWREMMVVAKSSRLSQKTFFKSKMSVESRGYEGEIKGLFSMLAIRFYKIQLHI